MDIEKPLEREFSLFAPEITKKKVHRKGKNRDPDDDVNFRGKIHSQKYLNYCRTVKLQGQSVQGQSVNFTVAKKYKSREEEGKKKGLSATPSSTLPWPAKRLQEFTDSESAYDCIIYFILSSLQGLFLHFLLAITLRLTLPADRL